MPTLIFQKLKSNKGIFLSLVAYPMLILLLGLGVTAFLDSTNGSQQVRLNYYSLRAQYYAYMGMEYAFEEIRLHSYGPNPFVTHTANLQTNALQKVPTPPAVTLPGPVINQDGNYQLVNGNDSFEVKIYEKEGATFILTKGTSNGVSRLFVNKITGTPLFEYFSFSSQNTSLGWQTWDAQGGKIHTNGDLTFYNGAKILNAGELSAYGKMQLAYYPSVQPGEESTWPSDRWPYVRPNNYPTTDPPPWPYPGGKDPDPDYRNKDDGYYAGQRLGLYMEDPKTGFFVPWDAAPDNPEGSAKPISPWGIGDGVNWNEKDLSYVYEQQDVNCALLDPSTCASATINNENYYTSHPSINGVYLPARLPNGNTYNTYKYYGHTNPGDPTVSIDLANSQEQQTAWQEFINNFQTNKPDDYTVTGLVGAVKAGQANDAKYVSTPAVDIQNLIAQAGNSGSGMVVDVDTNQGAPQVAVKINTTNIYRFDATTNNSSYTATCSGQNLTLFTKKIFKNTESGQSNSAVEVNIGNLMACEQAAINAGEGAGKWLPKNGLIYSTENVGGLALANAAQLPTNGLTTIVKGNLILKGQYNYPLDEIHDWFWQPSAAIVSNQVYLASDSFSYPGSLPVTQRHSDYPYEQTVGGSNLPAGIGTGAQKDFTSGYNWIATYNNQMANEVTGGGLAKTIYYGLSLVGPYATSPRSLERWGYYLNPGTAVAPPSGWVDYTPVVVGNFIQLTNEFPPVGTVDTPNYRYCDQASYYPVGQRIQFVDIDNSIPFDAANYPCRGRAGATDDLLTHYNNEERKYETNYATNLAKPPGNFGDLTSSLILELPFQPNYWNYHNPELG